MDQLGKIRRYHRKERLKISIFAKFESDLSKPNEYIVPQRSENLPTFIWWYGEGQVCALQRL